LYSKMVLYGVPLTRLEMKNYIEKHLGLKWYPFKSSFKYRLSFWTAA
jgi:hypothetical protein